MMTSLVISFHCCKENMDFTFASYYTVSQNVLISLAFYFIFIDKVQCSVVLEVFCFLWPGGGKGVRGKGGGGLTEVSAFRIKKTVSS